MVAADSNSNAGSPKITVRNYPPPASSEPPPLIPGQTLGRYKLVSLLGTGAMGKVFRAEDALLKRHVALKVLPKPLKDGKRTYAHEQFIREARSAAQLDHPHIVRVYDAGEDRGLAFISMELVDGGTLESIVKGAGPFDVARACQLAADAAEALAFAHQHGIVHRDVKPTNLLLSRGGRCKLSDFGLAKFDDPEDLFRLPNESVGTPLFTSPEVFRAKPASPASDVYSLAATCYVLLAGRPPFPGGTVKEIGLAHVQTPPPEIRTLNPQVPEGLSKLLLQALEKDPKGRPTADQMAKALRAFSVPVSGGGSGVGSPPLASIESIAAGKSTHPMANSNSNMNMPNSTHPNWMMPVVVGSTVAMLVLVGLIAGLLMRQPAPAPAVAHNVASAPTTSTPPPSAAAPAPVPATVGATPAPVAIATPAPSPKPGPAPAVPSPTARGANSVASAIPPASSADAPSAHASNLPANLPANLTASSTSNDTLNAPTPVASADRSSGSSISASRTPTDAATTGSDGSAPAGIVPWNQAAQFLDQTITIEGRVIDTGKSKTGNVTFLNFSRDRGLFYIAIIGPAATVEGVSAESYYLNKKIRVQGKVTLFSDRPQMRVDKPGQIQIVP